MQNNLNLFEEIRWGNDYFHAIQSCEGYLPFGVYTGDYYDESRDWWEPAGYVLVTKPAALYLQHNFIAIQALLARLFEKSQSEYAPLVVWKLADAALNTSRPRRKQYGAQRRRVTNSRLVFWPAPKCSVPRGASNTKLMPRKWRID